MSDGIDQKKGTINVRILCPEPGDTVVVVNCGSHYEVRHQNWTAEPLYLTDEDIEQMRMGEIIWH